MSYCRECSGKRWTTEGVQDFAVARLGKREGAELLGRIVAAGRQAGLLQPAPMGSAVRLCGYALCVAVCLHLAWFTDSVALLVIALQGLAYFTTQLAFLGHGALHGAVSGKPGINQLFGQVSMTAFGGLCFEEWKKRHREHHLFCQVEGRDPDMAVEFAASLTAGSARSKGKLARALGRFQGTYVWGLALLFGHSQRVLSQLEALAKPVRYRRDLAFLAIHYGLWIGLPLVLQVPAERVIIVYLVPATLLGLHLAAVFWVNHVGMPLIADPKAFSIVERQVRTSRNIRVHAIVDSVFGGLNYQIEHHLMPSCPPFRLRRLQQLVRPLLLEAGLPYNESAWGTALRDVGAHFSAIGALLEKPG